MRFRIELRDYGNVLAVQGRHVSKRLGMYARARRKGRGIRPTFMLVATMKTALRSRLAARSRPRARRPRRAK